MADMLNHYLKLWDLTDPEPLAETATSHVYTVTSEGTRVVLKVLTPIGLEEKNGAAALRYWNGRGSVKLLREDEQAHLLEYADGQDLTVLVKNGQDEEVTLIIADVLNQLHAPSMSPMPTELTPLKIWVVVR